MNTPAETKLDILIVDNDMDIRTRLRHATTNGFKLGTVLKASNLNEARELLSVDTSRFDLVFISDLFPAELSTEFIRRSKDIQGGQDAAYVMILGNDDDTDATLAQSLIAGADGFLSQPYSIDDLVGICHLAIRIRRERQAAREALAVKFIVRDIIKYLDVTYRLLVSGCDYSDAKAKLEEVCAKVQVMQPEAIERYYQVIVDQFMLRPIPDPSIKEIPFKGMNPRLRRRIGQRVVDGIERRERNETELGTKLKELPPPKGGCSKQ